VFFFYLLQVVMNAFIDPYEFTALTKSTLTTEELHGESAATARDFDNQTKAKVIEHKPMFHECEL
jgi:hypothetical protein